MAQTRTITLLTGDYAQRLSDLAEAAANAEKAPDGPLAGEEHPRDLIAAEYEELRTEAVAASEAADRVVTLEGVGRRVWRRLKIEHPPRTDDVDEETIRADRRAGVNTETVEDDLVHAAVIAPVVYSCAGDQDSRLRACTDENECSHRAAFNEWADELSEGEWSTLLREAFQRANVAVFDPKSLPAWRNLDSDTN